MALFFLFLMPFPPVELKAKNQGKLLLCCKSNGIFVLLTMYVCIYYDLLSTHTFVNEKMLEKI